MRIDLHTHSTVSDGTLPPDEVMQAAAAAGLDVVALTDHDCCHGWDDARKAAERLGITLVPGLEVSTRFAGQGVHLLGYLPDASHPPLVEELGRVLDGRNSRLPAILSRLRDLGLDLDAADVLNVAGDAAATGRPHIADAMIAKGMVRSRDEAFARYLGPGGPAYVDRYAADLEGMIRLIGEAGGVSVVAHPWAGGTTRARWTGPASSGSAGPG